MKLYNTASRKREDFFLPEGQNKVRMYCCGPTVYHYAHIGNLRAYLMEDLLRRVLEYNDYKVNHVVNITDVGHLTSNADDGDDKMEKGAFRTGKTVWEVAEFYTEAFRKDIARLNILEPTTWCKATDHIDDQVALVKTLEEKGFTYRLEDGIYFDSTKFPRYADFARLDIEGLEEGARVESTAGKKNVTDFSLWKFSPVDKQRAMEWKSPWGTGFPGWHVECSAMSMHYLGPTLDIHCGGSDHVRVHHSNEIAQSECATGQPFCRYWMHVEFLRADAGKMSKSTGDFLTLQLLIDKGFDALDYRYLALGVHYRQYLNFSFESLKSAREAHRSLRKRTDPVVKLAGEISSKTAFSWQKRFRDAVSDDLNVANGLGILNTMLKNSELSPEEKGALTLDFDRVFGLKLGAVSEIPQPKDTVDTKWVESMLEQRMNARKNKDFAESDRIRNELAKKKIQVKDSAQGSTWEIMEQD